MSDEKHEQLKGLAKELLEAESDFAVESQFLQNAELAVTSAKDALAKRQQSFHKVSWALEQAKAAMFLALNEEYGPADPAEYADGSPRSAPTEVRKQDEQDAADNLSKSNEDILRDIGVDPETGIYTPRPIAMRADPAQEAPAIPEGFIPWGGGEYLPVARGTPLVVLYRNGSEVDCTAGDEMSEFWHRSSTLVDHSPDHDIIAYRVIETGETQSELDSSQIEGGDRVEPLHDRPKLTNEEFESLEKIDGVLDAEPSPILRSEVPPAAETYLAPSGDEFATVNGQTHLIVSDEAEAQGQAETAPQAAYAPIHNEDEPSDAAVFAHGLNVEIDAAKAQDQKFNPFWLFGGAKKTLVGEGV